MDQDKEYVLKLAHANKVKFIRLWFTDILGFLKSFAITIEELEDALAEGVRFDGSTLLGFARDDEREMIALPDASTFRILPWRPREDSVARIFCDIHLTDMSPFEGDPRYVLKRNLTKAAEKGYTFYTGPEIEFFFFKNAHSTETLDTGGYFDLTPLDTASDYRRRAVLILEEMDIGVISSHHEAAYSQHEIDLRHEDALTMADNIMTFRVVIREVAVSQGIQATFMPKPFTEYAGSGMHTHVSLFEGDNNAFYDASDEFHLSKVGRQFVAGLLRHSAEITAVTNQWVNSYKRLAGGGEAPSYVCWGRNNRSALVRVPLLKPDKPSSARVEFRSIDSAANPYLAYALMLNAGLAGIKGEYELPDEAADDVWSLSDRERRALGITQLPRNLDEAIRVMEQSELAAETLGESVFDYFLRNKRAEFADYARQVTPYEVAKMLPVV